MRLMRSSDPYPLYLGKLPLPPCLQTHILHGQTYLYDCSIADVLRNWKRLDRE